MRLSRLVIAIFATTCLLAGSGVLAISSAASAAGTGSGVLMSQLRTRSASSQFDEYVQITNTTSATVDLSGWQLYDCSWEIVVVPRPPLGEGLDCLPFR
jgi:hypothetical protein